MGPVDVPQVGLQGNGRAQHHAHVRIQRVCGRAGAGGGGRRRCGLCCSFALPCLCRGPLCRDFSQLRLDLCSNFFLHGRGHELILLIVVIILGPLVGLLLLPGPAGFRLVKDVHVSSLACVSALGLGLRLARFPEGLQLLPLRLGCLLPRQHIREGTCSFISRTRRCLRLDHLLFLRCACLGTSCVPFRSLVSALGACGFPCLAFAPSLLHVKPRSHGRGQRGLGPALLQQSVLGPDCAHQILGQLLLWDQTLLRRVERAVVVGMHAQGLLQDQHVRCRLGGQCQNHQLAVRAVCFDV
mmetsp:Transcript_59478/g.106096  ORF Transcript_59478/g.106096 Transcript_59478/m.106096 type:complete len:298 (-) Transcript_59478:934-1827(-)